MIIKAKEKRKVRKQIGRVTMRNMDVMKCLNEKVKSEYHLKEMRELVIWISGGKAFQTEGRGSTNALMQGRDWYVPGTVMSPI